MGNDDWRGGTGQVLQQMVQLGTGAVSTQTVALFKIPRNAVVKGIRYYGNAAPTASALTAEMYARTAAGAAGVSLQSAATDIDFASAAAAKAGVAASLSATAANLRPAEDRLIEVVITATSCTAGPGDLVCALEFDPRY